MRRAQLSVGDRVEVNVRGHRFEATVRDLDCPHVPGKPVLLDPPPGTTFFHVAASQIERRVERAAERRAAA